MKLYTEEQVRKQKEVLEDIIDLWDEGLPLDSHTVEKCKNILSKLTPIELPSDEEIEKNGYHESDYDKIWKEGAKWMRDKILNKNK